MTRMTPFTRQKLGHPLTWTARLLFNRKMLSFFSILFFLTSSALGQSLPLPSSCTSKDLELVGATLPPPANDPCACGGTRTLMLTINNKTGSTRTSFALWGTLIIRDSEGNIKSSEPIFACAPNIPKNAVSTLPSDKSITYSCGESLEIVDLFLAWTSASPGETCDVLKKNPSLIAPKCGTLPSIRVLAGVNADLTATDATCNTGSGSIQVKPYGGLAPYKVKIGSNAPVTVAGGGSTTFSNLASGNYTITVEDARLCTVSLSKTVRSPEGVSAPQSSVAQPTCSIATGTVTVTNVDNTVTYELKQGGTLKYTAVNGVFTNVAPGTYQLTGTKGVCSASGSDVTVSSQPSTPSAPAADVTQPTCAVSTGTIVISAPVGSGITYSIGNGYQSGTTFSNLAPGNYTITAKSADGCVSAGTVKTVNQQLTTPSAPTAAVTQPTCAVGTGSIVISAPIGNGITYSIGNGYQSGTTFSNLAPGNYTITAKSADGCVSTETVKTVDQQPATPDAPTICVTQPSLCGPSKGSITVMSPAAGTGHMYSIDNGQSWHQTNEFSGLAAGSNPSVLVRNSAGCISSASHCSDATNCNANTQVSNSTAPVTENRAQNNLGAATLESSVTVTATPNPFTSKVRFTITASKSGRGVLDVYNIQGQKIKTVYQGYIQAGVNYFDLSLPATRNSQLIYVLTMGDERISGKMLQMGNR